MQDLTKIDIRNLNARQFYALAWGFCGLSFLFLYFVFVRKAGLQFQGDSAGYIFFSPIRPIGYSVFLWAVRTLTGGLAAIPWLQTLIMQVSYGWLAVALYQATGRPLAALAALVALTPLSIIFKMQSMVTTEPLTTALISLWAAQVLLFLRRPDWRGYGLLCGAAALSVLVRPGNIILFPVSGGLLLVCLGQNVRVKFAGLAAILVISFAVAVKANALAYLAMYHTPQGGSPFSRDLMQKVMFATGGDTGGPAGRCDTDIIERGLAPARDYVQKAPPFARSFLEQRYGDRLKFNYLLPAVANAHGYDAEWKADPIFLCQAEYRIARHPFYYLSSVASAYFALTSYSPQVSFARQKAFNQYMLQNPPPPAPPAPLPASDLALEQAGAAITGTLHAAPPPAQTAILFEGKGSYVVHLLMSMISLGVMFSPVAALIAAWKRWGRASFADARWQGAVAIFLGVQGVIFVTALLEYGLPRYVQPLWAPALAGLVVAWAAFAAPASEENDP